MDTTEDLKLGIVRGVSYGVFGGPDVFMPEPRALGARVTPIFITA